MMNTLLRFLLQILGVKESQEEKIERLTRRARYCDSQSMGILAYDYYHGVDGLKEDHKKAAAWAKKASNLGDGLGCYIYGCCLMYGKGVEKDKKEGARMHRKAIAKKYEPSMFALALYYKDLDNEEAIHWFKRCMDAYYANTKSIDELAEEHLKDLGVHYDPKHPGKA